MAAPERSLVARSSSHDRVVTYLPDNSLRNGYLSVLRDIAEELWSGRWLMLQLFKRDMFAFYKQSFLGVLWVFFVPIVTVGTFLFLKGSGVVSVGEIAAPYPVFAVTGIAVWQLFSEGVVAGASSLVAGGDMIARINFSKKSMVIASMGRTVVSFLIVLVLLVLILLVYATQGYHPPIGASLLLAPLALLPMLLFTVGMAFILALLNGVVRDIGNMLSMVLTFVMLLTPILYQRPVAGPGASTTSRVLATVTEYNPLYYLVVAPRELLLDGRLGEPRGFAIASAACVVLFCASLVGFHLTETRIAERI